MAALYVASRFRATGLSPMVPHADTCSYRQHFKVVRLQADSEGTRLEGVYAGVQRAPPPVLGVTCVPGSPLPAGGEGVPVFCGYGASRTGTGRLHTSSHTVSGKVVVAVHGGPRRKGEPDLRKYSPHAKLRTVARAGAITLILIPDPREKEDKLAKWQVRRGWRGGASVERLVDSPELPPLFLLSDVARDSLFGPWLARIMAHLEMIDNGNDPVPVSMPEFLVRVEAVPVSPETLMTCNVVGALGEGPTAIVVGAHYDHLGASGDTVFPGADDNASGVAALLETARLLSTRSLPGIELIFVAFGAEEQGQLGSLYYQRYPARPLEATALMVCLDSVGREGVDHYRRLGSPPTSGQRRIYVYSSEVQESTVQEAAVHLALTLTPSSSPLLRWGSDHLRFEEVGVPVLFYFSGIHADHHQLTDTIDKLDTKKLCLLVTHVCNLLTDIAEER